MKKLFVFIFAMTIGLSQAQEKKEPTFVKEGNLVKATYFYANGGIHQQGFFKDNKLTGMWTEFDKKGNKTTIGFYKEGKKVGKWFQWHNNLLREITFSENGTKKVSVWKEEIAIASNR